MVPVCTLGVFIAVDSGALFRHIRYLLCVCGSFLFSLISRSRSNTSNVLLGLGLGMALFTGGMIKPSVLVVAVVAVLACASSAWPLVRERV